MADQFIVVPAHVAIGAAKYDSREEAAVIAANLVEKDRTPRVVLQVLTKVEVSAQPRVDIVHVDGEETASG